MGVFLEEEKSEEGKEDRGDVGVVRGAGRGSFQS